MKVHVQSECGNRLVYDKEYLGVKVPGIRDVLHPRIGHEVLLPEQGVAIIVNRDRYKKLPVTIIGDSMEKTVQVKPVISGTFIANIWHAYPLLSFGFLVDMKNPNRFGYPRKVYIDMRTTNDRQYYYNRPLRRMAQPDKLSYVDLDFSFPFANITTYNWGSIEPSTGMLSAMASLNGHYARYRFVALEYTYNSFPGWYPGERFPSNGDTLTHREQQGWMIALKHNHVLRRFELGYGLAFWSHTALSDYRIYPESLKYRTYFKHDVGLALSLYAYYQLKDFMAVGASCQPQIVSLGSSPQPNNAFAWSMGIKFRLSPLFEESHFQKPHRWKERKHRAEAGR